MKIEKSRANGINQRNINSNMNENSNYIFHTSDQLKRSPNYNQSMNRKKEASPVITTGNHSSRTIKEDEELFRNGVGGPFV